jgi:hypothetical protein
MLLTNLVFIVLFPYCFGLSWLLIMRNSFLAVHTGTPQDLLVRYAVNQKTSEHGWLDLVP